MRRYMNLLLVPVFGQCVHQRVRVNARHALAEHAVRYSPQRAVTVSQLLVQLEQRVSAATS